MAEAEHKGGASLVPGQTDHHTIGCALALDLDPIVATWCITAVGALGHDALDGEHRQPLFGKCDLGCLLHKLQARVQPEHGVEGTEAAPAGVRGGSAGAGRAGWGVTDESSC